MGKWYKIIRKKHRTSYTVRCFCSVNRPPPKDGRYRAYINFRRKQYYLETYDRLEDALAARKEGERKIFGEYIKSMKAGKMN